MGLEGVPPLTQLAQASETFNYGYVAFAQQKVMSRDSCVTGYSVCGRSESECHLGAVGGWRAKQVCTQIETLIRFFETQSPFGYLETLPQ